MLQAIDPAEARLRQRKMVAAAVVLAPFTLLDLALENGGTVAVAGAAWCLSILAGAALQRARTAAARGLGLCLGALGGGAALVVKAQLTGGTASLFYPLLLALPLLVLALGPDLPLLVAVTGVSASLAGAAIRHHEGRPLAEVAYWVLMSTGTVGLAVLGALLQGRQQRALASERARAEAMEAQAEEARRRGELERYAEVGRLAATVSHELSNPLASVTANLRWLEGADAIDPAERQAALRDAREAVQRIGHVVHQIRLVAHASDADQAEAPPAPPPALTPSPGRLGAVR